MYLDRFILAYLLIYFVIITITIYLDMKLDYLSRGLLFFRKRLFTKILATLVVLLIVFWVYVNFPLPHEKIDGLISNVFKVCSIIIALIISYIFTKLFRIRGEKEQRKEKIKLIAYKITEFRRLLYYILQNRSFWGDYSDIEKLKKYYPEYSYNDLHDQHKPDEKVINYWLKENSFSKTRADVYLASKLLVGDRRRTEWVSNLGREIEYDLEKLQEYYYPTSVYWYYFDHKYYKHTKGLFNFNELNTDAFIKSMKNHVSNIIDEYKSEDFDRNLLADIGSEIHNNYLPNLIELTRINEGKLPSMLTSLIVIILIIGVFGVLIPLIGYFGEFDYAIDRIISLIAVETLAGCLVWILLEFSNLVRTEIQV